MCVRCGKTGRTKARRMCDGCYEQTRRDGTANRWPIQFRHGGDVIAFVCASYDITIVDLVEHRDQAVPRRLAAHLMADDLSMRPSQISRQLGWAENTVRHWLCQPRPIPPVDAPVWVRRTVCPVPNCGRPSHSGRSGLCAGHNSRRRRTGGQILSHIPLKPMRTGSRIDGICRQSATSYRDGCRCDDCLRAATRRKQLNELAGPTLVDIGPVVAHLLEAKRRGMPLLDVAAASGVPVRAIYRFTAGKHARTRRATAEAILAVPLKCERCDQPGLAGGRWCKHHYLSQVRSAA